MRCEKEIFFVAISLYFPPEFVENVLQLGQSKIAVLRLALLAGLFPAVQIRAEFISFFIGHCVPAAKTAKAFDIIFHGSYGREAMRSFLFRPRLRRRLFPLVTRGAETGRAVMVAQFAGLGGRLVGLR